MSCPANPFARIVVFLLLIGLTSPVAVFAQKGKSVDRKVPTPNGPGVTELIYAVTSTNLLVSFNSLAPGSLLSSVAITGLQGGESVLGIDFRPATRQLFALGSTSRLYTINLSTGVALIVGTQFTTLLNGTAFGFDFNPTVDRIRVTSDANQNLRLNPNNGAIAGLDTNLAYALADPNTGFDPNVVGSAYTNNFSGATTTSLYDIDSNLDILALQSNPNGGILNTVGPLGVNTTDLVGFDISRATSTAYASLTAPAATTSGLYTINLTNGAATLIGTIGGGITIRDISVAPVAQAGDLIISEFRLRGPAGANDEFVEIYNASAASQTVTTFDGSSGFAVAASDGIARFVIPNGTIIPQGGHYLGANSAAGGYSLGTYPAGDGTTATPDATYTVEIPDNVGIALFNTSNAGNFNILNRLDSVGPNTEANTIYKEGTGYPPITTGTLNYSFFRNLRSGLPQDTNNNFASAAAELPSATPQNDFVFADPSATLTNAGQRLGAPGPENLSSPIQRNSTIKASLIAPCMSSSSPPNRVRNGSGNSGTLEIRRKFTNNTSAPVTRLRFRIVDITGPLSAVSFADLRAVTSTTVTETEPCSATTITLNGLTLETPPAQGLGGGFNSSLSAETVTLGVPIGVGASINVNFLLNIAQAGTFRYFLTVEALP
ncbi:MAG TPA: DUF4394 domain-containing protein [Pyrinomonadaceae bacterium]|nr:DUF4394 domain-containing protein [Pyrinomonadaceae bacterium]